MLVVGVGGSNCAVSSERLGGLLAVTRLTAVPAILLFSVKTTDNSSRSLRYFRSTGSVR